MKNFRDRFFYSFFLVIAGLAFSVLFTNCTKSSWTANGPQSYSEDPLLWMAWHLENTGQKVFAKNGAKSGVDLNLQKSWISGLSGKGIRVLISDDGIEDTHEDLKENYLYGNLSKDYTKSSPYLADVAVPINTDDNHGTAVAGLVAAMAVNGVGARGVAPKALIASANFLSNAVTQSEGIMIDQASGDYDIFNMSWGSRQNNLSTSVVSFLSQLRSGALNGRNGKGSIYVKSSGNDFIVYCRGSTSETCVGNANFDEDNSSPYIILTSALNSSGIAATYSSAGANIWVSSFGGEFGSDYPAMVTTDRTSCNSGFSVSNSSSTIGFEKGGSGNSQCKYTATFNGTSAAAPVLSGAIALILEANPNLTWRDVKYILAKTATPVNYVTTGSIAHPSEAIPAGAVWEQVWLVNAAGFKFHNWYGFGKINVDAAVDLARTYQSHFGPLQDTGWAHSASGLNLTIPDFSATGVTSTISVGINIKIEAVQLRVNVTHPDISNLAIELTSPSGTKSIIVNMNNSLRNLADYVSETMLSNAFYGETSAGEWTLRVIDGKSTNVGVLTGWSLNFLGSN